MAKKVEDMTVKEMREFSKKADIAIPKELTKRDDILAFLKNPKKSELSPTEKTAAELKAKKQAEIATRKKTAEEKFKKQCKVPLTESDKKYLAELEAMARSGKSPNTDQMRDLRVLREREKITPLSPVEERELEELEVQLEAPDVNAPPASGIPQNERAERLRKRRKEK